MRTDLKGNEVRRLLTHEYIHHIFDGLANDFPLPTWLTEGLSKYYEVDTALGRTAGCDQAKAFDFRRPGSGGSPIRFFVHLGCTGKPERLEFPDRRERTRAPVL
ncbi:MAG: hypothetical protein CL696_11210 [Chloroflexi bacterium]|nr:hypothetical protein [Chloroflexota bacterium]